MDYKEDIIRTSVRKNGVVMRSKIASDLAKRGKRKSPVAKVAAVPDTSAKQALADYIANWTPGRQVQGRSMETDLAEDSDLCGSS